MPDREILTLLDLVYYQFAKIMAQEELARPGFEVARRTEHGRAKDLYHDLKAGRKLWPNVVGGNGSETETERRCAFCGRYDGVELHYLVPASLHINERCSSCEKIQSQANQAWACADCAGRKGRRGLYTFYRNLYPDESKFYHRIPRSVEKRYLKALHDCLNCAGVLGAHDMDGDGDLTVLDLDYALQKHGRL
jgi:hypothetical protein